MTIPPQPLSVSFSSLLCLTTGRPGKGSESTNFNLRNQTASQTIYQPPQFPVTLAPGSLWRALYKTFPVILRDVNLHRLCTKTPSTQVSRVLEPISLWTLVPKRTSANHSHGMTLSTPVSVSSCIPLADLYPLPFLQHALFNMLTPLQI
jgi:hypothetical protein